MTAKVVAERHLARVMEAEHRLLEQLFPRHILQQITEDWTDGSSPLAAAAAAAAAPSASCQSSATGMSSPRGLGDYSRLATWHPACTLLFADIAGFTAMAKAVAPHIVMAMLNDLFSRFDALLDRFPGVFKVGWTCFCLESCSVLLTWHQGTC